MPRYREPFTVFPRKLVSGKTVYYFRTYGPDGRRTTAHSTGKTNKTQARNYCADLLSQGLLYSSTGMTFGIYADNFFDENSQWYSDKVQTSKGKAQPVAYNTLRVYRHSLNTHILPFFRGYKLIDIKPYHIKEFRSKLLEKEVSNSVINTTCCVLKIIFSYAISDQLITINPMASIPMMYQNARIRSAFSLEELKDIFDSRWRKPEYKMFCITAAVTGMRISEVCALRKETLFDNYINVKDQRIGWDLLPVKDGEKRKVRICVSLQRLLSECYKPGNDFIFNDIQNTYRRAFYLNTESDRKNKGLTFHSLRHFFNTYLLTNGISEIKVKSVLGHSSGKGSMTERYANFRPEDFDDVAELQEKLLGIFLQ